MNIIVAVKMVPDDQDILVASDGTLDFSKAKPTISAYDVNAIEEAAQLAAANDAKVIVVTAGPASIDDSKLKKNVLARGADELVMAADDSLSAADSHATAQVLAALVEKVGDYSVVLFGDGSADEYAQQVDVQVAAALGIPAVTAARRIEVKGDVVEVERVLEDEVQTVEVALPVAISVVPDIAVPRIPGMKDILAAGKKPMDVGASPVAAPAPAVEVVSCAAPQAQDRKQEVEDASSDGAIDRFAAALKAAL